MEQYDSRGVFNLVESRWVKTYLASTSEIVGHYAAFTAAELGVMLPSGFDTMRIEYAGTGWRGYDDSGADFPTAENLYPTEAEARAVMLIHLLESGLVTAPEVNARLTQS